MSKIIVVGSLNMDLVISAPYMPIKGETLMGSDFITSPGGKGANQGVAASRLSGDVYLIGCVGNDIFGKDLIKNLENNNVNVDYVKMMDSVPTGIAVIILVEGDNRIILDSGANFEITKDQVENAIQMIGEKDDILLVQLEIPLECVKSALMTGKEIGMRTILNPAPATKLSDEIYKHVDIITPNESECELLTGIRPADEVSIKKIVNYFSDNGINEVVITLGKDGVAYGKNGVIKKMGAQEVKVVDTTGAGDSFIGALAQCLSQDMDMDDAISFCTIVGALTVTKKGAQNSMPYYDEVINYNKK